MRKYGDAAVIATNLYRTEKASSPVSAWEIATSQLFGAGSPGQKKACPKGAYLGLAEEGYLIGVLAGTYTRSQKNKAYAINAVRFLHDNPAQPITAEQLWAIVIHHSHKVYNHQMDVVLALRDAGLLRL